MEFLTLEEAKQKFEIGTKGFFLVSIGTTGTTLSNVAKIARKLNLIAPERTISFLPVTSVSYLVSGVTFQELSFGNNKVSLPYLEQLPEELSLEYLDDSNNDIECGLLEWYKETPMYKTGRMPRDISKYCLQVRVYHFDKPESGQGLKVNAKDIFDVIANTEVQKSNTQGVSANSNSLVLKVIAHKREN